MHVARSSDTALQLAATELLSSDPKTVSAAVAQTPKMATPATSCGLYRCHSPIRNAEMCKMMPMRKATWHAVVVPVGMGKLWNNMILDSLAVRIKSGKKAGAYCSYTLVESYSIYVVLSSVTRRRPHWNELPSHFCLRLLENRAPTAYLIGYDSGKKSVSDFLS